MPLEFLRNLADEDRFPIPVVGEADIDKLRVLRAAGMVEAALPDTPHQPAHLFAITGLGRASLRAQVARQVIERRRKVLADKHLLA